METLLNTEETITKVNGYFKKSVQNIIKIGTELNNVKTEKNKFTGSEKDTAALEYNEMYTKLGFGSKVGDKFIKISQDKYIAEYIDYMPSSYNTLYMLSGKTEKQFKKLIDLKLNPATTGAEVKVMIDAAKGHATALDALQKKKEKETTSDKSKDLPTVDKTEDAPTADISDNVPTTGGAETPNDDTSKTEDKNTSAVTDNVSLIGDGTTPLVDMVKVVSIEINKDLISGNDAVIAELSNLQNKMFELIKGVSAKVEMETPDLTVLKVGVKLPMKNAA